MLSATCASAGSRRTARGSSRHCPRAPADTPAFAGACFGPDLRRFALMQYHQSQTTLPRLATLLQSVGVAISKREIQRLLTEGRTASWPKTATCCGPACRPRLGYLSMTPARGIKRRTAIARRSATSVSPRPSPGQALVRHAVIKEPAELSRSAARRTYRLRVERRGIRLHA